MTPQASGGTLYFIGVTTAASSINRVFPRWAALLGLGDAKLVGIDLPVGVGAATLRPAIAAIAADRQARGALVTTHKIAVAEHAADLFAEIDPWAQRLGEIGAIVRRDGELIGHATDPVTSGLALDALVGADWWRERPDAAALLLGAGGASLALAAGLLGRTPDRRPRRIVIADVAAERLAHCRSHLAASPAAGLVRFEPVSQAADNDRLVAALPPGSLVVNGTGLGKDRPGSPLTDAAQLPQGGAAWELNYRGDLVFLRQARAQQTARRLTVGDGWRYFVHGWSHVVALAFGVALDAATDARLLAAAGDALAMTGPLLLAIDVGTQSVRAALVEPDGTVAAVAGRPHDAAVPQPGWSEQNPAAWWEGVKATIGETLARLPGAAARIAAIGCCGQMHAPVPVDRDGRCLAPAVQLWNDKRCAGQVAAFAARPDAATLAAGAANPPAPAWIGFKAAWLRDCQPAAYEAAASLLTPKDFINLRLTGVAATDFSEASGSFLLDWRARSYDTRLADALGIDLAKLPPIHRSDAVIGTVSPDAAAATGLRMGTKVVAGGGDFPVSLLGAGVAGEGVGSDITGTSNLLSLTAATPVLAPGVMNLCGVGGGWIAFTIIDAGGDSLKWARRAFADEATSYEAISTLAAAVPPGAEGLMFLPYLSGERIGGRERIRAQFRGLSARHDKAHLFRAVMEGVCLASRRNFAALRDQAPMLRRLIATGGGANSAVWVQIKADMFGLPVAVPHSTEAGLIGCAALAGVAAGLFADQDAAAAALVRFARIVEPRPEFVALYDELAEEFEAAWRDLG